MRRVHLYRKTTQCLVVLDYKRGSFIDIRQDSTTVQWMDAHRRCSFGGNDRCSTCPLRFIVQNDPKFFYQVNALFHLNDEKRISFTWTYQIIYITTCLLLCLPPKFLNIVFSPGCWRPLTFKVIVQNRYCVAKLPHGVWNCVPIQSKFYAIA